jgi:hypothetical protein
MPRYVAVALISVALCRSASVEPESDVWAAVDEIMTNFHNLTDCDGCNCHRCHGFAFTAGDASGRKYTFEKGRVTMTKNLLLASASKFPAALAIAGAVAAGHLAFDTHAHEVFEWWSSNASDPRNRVTLRHLLSFTSGFNWPDPNAGNVSCMNGVLSSDYTPEECAREIYHKAPFQFAAGSTFDYNSFHLQIAAAMAAKAAGLSVQQLLHANLIDKLGLRSTGWLAGQNPLMAVAAHSTPDEYDRILRAYLSNELLPESVAVELERDYLAPPYATAVSEYSVDLAAYFGHYSMCNWFECLCDEPVGPPTRSCMSANGTFPPVADWLTPACRGRKIHMDIGLFGYFPLIDRAKGMYMQIAQSVIVGLDDTNDGCSQATNLRQLVKPHVDHALGVGPEPPPADVAAPSEGAPPPRGFRELGETVWIELAAALEGWKAGRQERGGCDAASVV